MKIQIKTIFDGFYPWSEDELVSMRPLVRNWLAALSPSAPVAEKKE